MQKIKLLSLSGLLLFWAQGIVWASVSISLSPIEGGATLRFDRYDVSSETNHELRVRITSTDNAQYEVFQRWAQPMASSAGEEVQRDFMQYYGLTGSNSAGTLYGQVPEYISMVDQLVYTSPPNGASDSFVLVYHVDPKQLQSSGQFMGRLVLTVRPIGSGQIQEAYLDVFVDADLGLKIKVQGTHGTDLIRLSTGNAQESEDTVSFSFENNAGELLVYQEVLSPLASVTDNTELVKGTVSYVMNGTSDRIRVPMPKTLEFGRELIYRSWESKDAWDVVYKFNPDTTFPLKAGLYRGRIRYDFENSSGTIKQFDFDIEVQIDPVFEMTLSFPNGMIDFGKLVPGETPKKQLVHVRVKSNLNRPYMVTQKLAAPLQNEHLQALDPTKFLFQTVAKKDSPGKVKFPVYEPVPTSDKDEVIYVSDSKGSPAEFDVNYEIKPYQDMSPGNYRAEVTFTLGEM